MDEFFGDGAFARGFNAVVQPSPGFALYKVNYAGECVLLAYGDLDGDGVGLQPVGNGVNRAVEVRADPVHLVDKADAGDVVGIGLPPDGFGLGLHAGYGVKDDNAAVQDA